MSPSKFDQVRAQLEQAVALPNQRPLKSPHRFLPRKKSELEAEFKKRLEEVRLRDLDEIFKADLQESKEKVDAIRQELSSQPSSPAIEPVKGRLLQVENQFLESGRLLRGLGKLDSPEDYLKMQRRNVSIEPKRRASFQDCGRSGQRSEQSFEHPSLSSGFQTVFDRRLRSTVQKPECEPALSKKGPSIDRYNFPQLRKTNPV